MDARRFDTLTRALSTSSSRRALNGLLATLLGLLGLTDPGGDDAAAKKQRRLRRKKKKAGTEGPCGDGSSKANRCKRDKQCCTGYCATRKKRKKGKVAGRCRCHKAGQSCTEDRSCCPEQTGRICMEGTCQAPLCAETCLDGCCTGEDCLDGDSEETCGTGGTQCQVCDASQLCVDGACKVCLAGACEPGTTSGCQYATLQEAIADADGPTTLTLCARTYQEQATIDIARNLTLIGAGTGQTILKGPGVGSVLLIAEGAEVSVQALTVTEGVRGIDNHGDLNLRDVAVTGNSTTNDGGGIFNNGTLTLADGSRVAGNTAHDGGGINNGGTVTLQTGSQVSGNTAANAGGGIINTGSLILEGGSRVVGNTAEEGGGILNGGATTVQANALVCDNTPADDQCTGGGTTNGPCPNPASGICQAEPDPTPEPPDETPEAGSDRPEAR